MYARGNVNLAIFRTGYAYFHPPINTVPYIINTRFEVLMISILHLELGPPSVNRLIHRQTLHLS